MRPYQDQIVLATVLGMAGLFVGLGSILNMTKHPGAFGWAVMLVVATIAVLIIGVILYRGHDWPRGADVWSLVAIGSPSLLLLFFGYTFTKQLLSPLLATVAL